MNLRDKLSPLGHGMAAQSHDPAHPHTLWHALHPQLSKLQAKLIGHSPLMGLWLIKETTARPELLDKLHHTWNEIQPQHTLSSIESAWLLNELYGLGPLQPLIEDGSLSEIMVNGPQHVYIEKQGQLHHTGIHFHDEGHLRGHIEKIAHFVGRQINHRYPMMDARLPDGSRVNAVIPPLTLTGSTLTIRRFSKRPYSLENFIQWGLISELQKDFLQACIQGRLNIVISGGTGSGKTTLLNALSFCIPDDERIVTIEDAAELQLGKQHVITMESRPASLDGDPPVGIRELVINALRMRPDRIIVGEVRGPETLDMLQAMNTGHDGSMTTGHANNPRDMLSRMETMVLFAGYDLPIAAIRRQICNALDLIIHVDRHRDGKRVIEEIVEVDRMEGDTITTATLFHWENDRLKTTGLRPGVSPLLESQGFKLPRALFEE